MKKRLYFKNRLNVPGLILIIAAVIFTTGSAFSQDVDTLVFEGYDALYRGDLKNALLKLETAVKIDPENEFAHNQLGIVYAKNDRFNDAFNEFLRVVKIDNRNTFAQKWLGILYLRKGEMNKAFERFNEIILVDPENADAYYFLGAIYNFRHNQAKAIEYLKKARDAASQEADTHYRLAKAFHNVDMTTNALQIGRAHV